MAKQTYLQSDIMRRFSTLAGPLQKIPRMRHLKPYKVAFANVVTYESALSRNWTRIVSLGAFAFVLGLCAILLQPSHWIAIQQPHSYTNTENWIMLFCLFVLQAFLIIGTLSASRSTLRAKDPIPVRPRGGMKVAFATTRAPGEPVAMVRKTLQAAKRVVYPGGMVDVWLLDETNSPELQSMCADLGVYYFTRAGRPEWNTTTLRFTPSPEARQTWIWPSVYGVMPHAKSIAMPKQFFAARSKHGNFNSWMEHLKAAGVSYDILAGVDTDQVPEPNYLERVLGYFRDPDVAYVVGPQVYGNSGKGINRLVARWAESQASFFQSTVQRAGNSSTSAMFVGTNYAIRMDVLRQIGGFQPCITEDMATGMAVHAKTNPVTGHHWKSVYTPDVLAVGEGPDYWGAYFSQQWRWAAGTFDTLRTSAWSSLSKMPAAARLHYLLMLAFYPISALTWLLGIISSTTYLFTGATAVIAPWGQFASLYMMTIVMQLSLYFWNRLNNVSPHEDHGSYGIPGIFLSALTAPIYLSAFVGVALGKKAQFVVTAKGGSGSPEWLPAFRIHLLWALFIITAVAYGFRHGHHHPAMLVWAFAQLLICIIPPVLGLAPLYLERSRPFKLITRQIQQGDTQNA